MVGALVALFLVGFKEAAVYATPRQADAWRVDGRTIQCTMAAPHR
ncbi:hypothetical protein WME99_23165 [Sorangium sp. So ce136]